MAGLRRGRADWMAGGKGRRPGRNCGTPHQYHNRWAKAHPQARSGDARTSKGALRAGLVTPGGGMPAGDVTVLQGSIITVIGALPPVISFVWGLFAHTDKAKLQSAANIVDPTTGKPTLIVTSAALAAATPGNNNIVAHEDVTVKAVTP